ncbi:beta-lactamase [Fervidicella metallireducens AeB]|uniref:Beta-lactamase n=1 Tax=Fervidicella metallireducens AeB TaxID=1403537 RepID=A0A017RYY0_9CLOT|nr:MBL fold metallo-hydrolase [Fervidicella metallireducens]EYE89801.1 beta-lactamase [Fervidicella metallireducens AeB]
MKIKWLGHSCFKIKSDKGIRIVTDPFDDNVGYKLPVVECDIVTTSHGHYDHNFIDCVKGNFEVIKKVGIFNVKDISITGIHTYHDEMGGTKRGDNIVYVMEVDGIRVCHLGDLGHVLTQSQINMIGKVDVLLIPVGGVYTINSEEAVEVVNQLKPSIVIPMHYKTPALKFNLDSVEGFLEKVHNVNSVNSQVMEIKKEDLNTGETKVYVLKYE